jgi:hypothetical protein
MTELRWQFVLGHGLSSQAIAWWGQAYGGWSHVDLLLPDGTCLGARSDAVGGKPPGVQIRPHAYEAWKRRTVLSLPCTAEQAAAGETFARDQVGMGYDKDDILGLILGIPLMQAGHWICSALQLAVAEAAPVIPPMHVTPQQCPPNMFFSIINAVGGQILEVTS